MTQVVATPPPAPAAPGAGVRLVVDGQTIAATPAAQYQALRFQRRVLQDQLGQLEEKRLAIASRLRRGEVTGADKAGLESRIADLDQQIVGMYKQVAAADARVAAAAGVPGSVGGPDLSTPRSGPPSEFYVFGGLVLMAAVLPISIAWARRLLRRPSPVAPVTAERDERLTRLEQAVDAVAIEVERIGESQRYYVRLLGAGPAQPIEVKEREKVDVR